jgi:RNA polymerase sigma-70 factor (ECF subfamily)
MAAAPGERASAPGYAGAAIDAPPGQIVAPPEDLRLVNALRAGDEAAFTSLVDMYYGSLLRLAMTFVSSRAVAEEVVQDTWIGVLRGLDRFEGRSSLKTWVFRILTNTAKTRAQREARSVPFSSLTPDDADEPSVDPGRFLDANHPTWPGHWNVYPASWAEVPDSRLLAKETRERIERAIEALPPQQRLVIRLRDVEGFSSEEVRELLDLSEVNQRVILHRARSKVRAALEEYLTQDEGGR